MNLVRNITDFNVEVTLRMSEVNATTSSFSLSLLYEVFLQYLNEHKLTLLLSKVYFRFTIRSLFASHNFQVVKYNLKLKTTLHEHGLKLWRVPTFNIISIKTHVTRPITQ